MENVITVKEVLLVIGIIGGGLGLFALLIWVVSLMNPFRSGH